MELQELIIQKLQKNFPDSFISSNVYMGDLSVKVDKKEIVKICTLLKEDSELLFILCEDVTAIDWSKRNNRFTVVYHIFSFKHNFRLRIKADVDESDCEIDTVSSVWKTANWEEREVYDMFGISFNNHPDLRRMYMPEDFEHYPLRKDFPLMGIPGSLSLPKK
ncbi:MAG: NADH-quinone oxidoreductase subunit C [Bacteroidetes bacterium]|nr:NADH-quinone oxidoreductase subunit C [Bacteroidota bacterium]